MKEKTKDGVEVEELAEPLLRIKSTPSPSQPSLRRTSSPPQPISSNNTKTNANVTQEEELDDNEYQPQQFAPLSMTQWALRCLRWLKVPKVTLKKVYSLMKALQRQLNRLVIVDGELSS